MVFEKSRCGLVKGLIKFGFRGKASSTVKKQGVLVLVPGMFLIGGTFNSFQFQVTANKMQRFCNYLFLQTLYMFHAVPSPIISSTQLYKQLQVLSRNTAASCYCG